jgi:hypothetical protein
MADSYGDHVSEVSTVEKLPNFDALRTAQKLKMSVPAEDTACQFHSSYFGNQLRSVSPKTFEESNGCHIVS